MAPLGVEELRFAAMGTVAHVIVVGAPPHAAEAVRRRVDDLELRWSRFRPTSELSRLNGHAGRPVRVSPETRLLLQRGIDGWRLTGGAFDPTVLGAVIRAGYDRTFDELDPGSAGGHSLLELGCEGIVIEGETVRLPEGTGVDSGGSARAWPPTSPAWRRARPVRPAPASTWAGTCASAGPARTAGAGRSGSPTRRWPSRSPSSGSPTGRSPPPPR